MRIRLEIVLAVIAASLIVVPAASAVGPLAPGKIGYATVQPVCPPPAPGAAACSALTRTPVPASEAGSPGVEAYKVGDGARTAGPAGGLTPDDLARAYGYAGTAGGSGQTVAIVDAYDDPEIESDLAEFDEHYGIAGCTKANSCFTKVSQTGSSIALPRADTTGWSVEISLDVETVHSACPSCKILLVETDSANFSDLAAGVNRAASMGATEVSNSYGGAEGELGPGEKAAYEHPGIVIAAATGDYGYDGWTSINEGLLPAERPNLPASLPSVVAVGGTTLDLTSEGARESESVWNGNGPDDDGKFIEGAGGGGCSTLFTAPSWQQDAPGFAASGCGDKRLDADVSAVADPLTGFDIYDSDDCGSACEHFKRGANWVTIGGTSLATPLISALYARAGGSDGVSYPARTLYGHLGDAADVFDVTEGGNGFCDGASEFACGHPDEFGYFGALALHVDCEYTTECDAATGFDGPSGVGTPNGLALFTPLESLQEEEAAARAKAEGEAAAARRAEEEAALDKAGDEAAAKTVREAAEAAARAAAKQTAVGVGAFKSSVAAVGPDATLAGTSLQVSASGTITLRISCPAGESRCAGTVSLSMLAAGRAQATNGRPLTLAGGSFAVAGGKVETVTLRLSAKARALLARLRTLRARTILLAHDPQGAHHTTQTLVTLRAPRLHTGRAERALSRRLIN